MIKITVEIYNWSMVQKHPVHLLIEYNIQMIKQAQGELQQKSPPSYKCFAIMTISRFT